MPPNTVMRQCQEYLLFTVYINSWRDLCLTTLKKSETCLIFFLVGHLMSCYDDMMTSSQCHRPRLGNNIPWHLKFESRSPGLGVRSGSEAIQSIVSHIRGLLCRTLDLSDNIQHGADALFWARVSRTICRRKGQGGKPHQGRGQLQSQGSHHFSLVKVIILIIKLSKSAIVEGNPWILFSTERFQEFLCFLEDGRYLVLV